MHVYRPKPPPCILLLGSIVPFWLLWTFPIFSMDAAGVASSAVRLLTYPFLLLFVLILLPIISLAALRRVNGKRAISELPPGSLGLPFVGETLRLITAYRSENPEPFVDERVRRHGGRLFTTHLFGERTVFSADPEFNRIVLGGEGRIFEASYPSSICTLLGRHSLVLMKGVLHKRMHALTLTRFASPAVIRSSLLPDIDRVVRRNLRSWPDSLRLLDQAKKITFELTVEQLISEEPGEWTEDLRRHYNILIDGFFSIPLPSFLTFTAYGKAIKARKKVAEALTVLVRRRKEWKMGDAVADSKPQSERFKKKDMVDELLEAEERFTEEEMVDFLLALIVAGHETTPTIMTLAAKFLTDNPSALVLLKEEQDEIRRKKKSEFDTLEWNDYKSSMPFTQCVINETLRVANIVGGVFRRAIADVHFKGYTIPKGCKVFASFRSVHLDNDYYEEARNFNPWRWLNQSNNVSQEGDRRSGGAPVFTPFGGGQRLCPGYELGRVEICVFLHYLVTCFSWEVAKKDKLAFFPTTRMINGYPIHARRHVPL